jgi:Cu/Ag efflux protein CusF
MQTPIRYALVVALAGAAFSSFSQAPMDHSAHGAPAAKPAMAMSEAAMEQGVVKKVDKATGKVSIAHDAQKGGMPAMTMVYKVKDAAALGKLQVGQKIRFTTHSADSDTLVRIEQVK